MSESFLHRAPSHAVLKTTVAGLAILGMTAIHHIYGAMILETPWRLHIVYISIPVALVILAAVALGRTSATSLLSRLASWIYALAVGGFAVIMIGIYEGGYNHLLPNLQYVLGVEHTLREGLYEPPDDLIFQLSGIAQFVIALPAAWLLRRLVLRSGDAVPSHAS